jgi:hypothetical protein
MQSIFFQALSDAGIILWSGKANYDDVRLGQAPEERPQRKSLLISVRKEDKNMARPALGRRNLKGRLHLLKGVPTSQRFY